MKTGAIIKSGLSDWQIIQQSEGFGKINVSGKYFSANDNTGVFVRIVKEDTGEEIIKWTLSENLNNCRWRAKIDKVPAGGLYRLETCVDQKDSFTHNWATRGDIVHYFGVGDLYVIAGQSNSAGYGKDHVYDPPELGVHLFANSEQWKLAAHPMNDSTGTKHEVNSEKSNSGNSPYLSFAKYLKRELHYPIGLIQTSLGGSPLCSWNPKEYGDLYRNMISVVKKTGGKTAGILWYQGCADTDNTKSADTYFDRFKQMVENTRHDLKDSSLPFLTVQLSRCNAQIEDMTDYGWNKVREAQRQAAQKIQNVYITPSLDFSMSDCIHISSSSAILLGERLAKLALQKIYLKNVMAMAPDILKAVQIHDDAVKISFSNVYEYLYGYEVPAKKLSLRLTDEKGAIPINDYHIENADIYILKLDRAIEGQAYIHNAINMDPEGNIPIDNATHLPLLSFYNVAVEKC